LVTPGVNGAVEMTLFVFVLDKMHSIPDIANMNQTVSSTYGTVGGREGGRDRQT